jgi:hypothetical protein
MAGGLSMVDKLSLLTSYTREFVRKCNRLLNDASGYYEPDTEESATRANLCAVVGHAEDTLIDIDTEKKQKQVLADWRAEVARMEGKP